MNIIWLELLLVAVVALGLGFWQLYDVTKALQKDSEQARDQRSHSGAGDSQPGSESVGLDSVSKPPDQVADVRQERDA